MNTFLKLSLRYISATSLLFATTVGIANDDITFNYSGNFPEFSSSNTDVEGVFEYPYRDLKEPAFLSFSSIYLDFAFKPFRNSGDMIPTEIRKSPSFYKVATGGFHFSDSKYSYNTVKTRLLYRDTPIADFFLLAPSALDAFSLSRINPEFMGRFAPKTNDGLLPSEEFFKNFLNECRTPRLHKASFDELQYILLECPVRQNTIFFTRLDLGTTINDTYGSEFTLQRKEKLKENEQSVFIVNILANQIIDKNEPFNTLASLPLPVNLVNTFIDQYYSLDYDNNSEISPILNQAIIKDTKSLQANHEDQWLDSLFNTKYKVLESKYTIVDLDKTPKNDPEGTLYLRNHQHNLYGNTLLTFSDANLDVLVSITAITPGLLNLTSKNELISNIAKDEDCKASNNDVRTEILNNRTIDIINCSNTFGTGEYSKTYYITPNLNSKAAQEQEQPLEITMVLGSKDISVYQKILDFFKEAN